MENKIYAFPSTTEQRTSFDGSVSGMKTFEGMELRDYFAAKALPALIEIAANGKLGNADPAKKTMSNGDFIAMTSYQLADAMLEARTVCA